jgi:hypothetical protein
MMWQAADQVILAACAAKCVPAGMRRARKWPTPGVSWPNS